EEARKIAEGWIRENRVRTYRGGATQEELLRVNAEESRRVADGFLSPAFLMNQYRFFRSRKKTAPALAFLALRATRPIWGQLLP
ncbi:MAG: enoyl-CoA hydratase/isomerase family protein, partial [Myxococcota bacterium]